MNDIMFEVKDLRVSYGSIAAIKGISLKVRKGEIVTNHKKFMEREKNNAPNKSLAEALADVLDIENSELPCLECHL